MSTIHARHILVETEDQAKGLLEKLNGGTTFEALASEHSKCPSGQKGGDLGAFGKGQMVKEFEDAAFGLEVDQVSSPIKTQFGYHIIQRVKD